MRYLINNFAAISFFVLGNILDISHSVSLFGEIIKIISFILSIIASIYTIKLVIKKLKQNVDTKQDT